MDFARMMLGDRLVNLVAGLGGERDKQGATRHAFLPLDPGEAAAAYRSDWIARKVIDIPAFDTVRAWRDWQAADIEIEAIEAEERRLALRQKIATALKWARLYGGSALILGARQGRVDRPLDVAAIGRGGLEYLHVVGRHEIAVGEIDRDPLSPFFGEPSRYQLNGPGAQVEIHPSRVIRFCGPEAPAVHGPADGWGDSVLQALDEAIKHAGLAAQGIAGLVLEAKVDVYKIKGLTSNVGQQDYRARMIERFRLANLAKSTVNALIVDAEEEYEQKTVNFSQLPDVLRLYLEIAAGAADIPATRLLGSAPDGMNATGEGDLRNYYDRIAAEQEMLVRPRLERLDEALIRSALGHRPARIHWRWAPLWQVSETERVANAKAQAETTKIYADSGLVPAEALAAAVRNQLIEAGTYPGLDAVWPRTPLLQGEGGAHEVGG